MAVLTIMIGLCLLAAVLPAGGTMVDPPEVLEVLRLHRELRWGTRRIAKHLGMSRTTVKKYIEQGEYQPYKKRQEPDPLGSHRNWAEARFLEVGGNVRVVQRELLAKPFEIGYSTLTRALRPVRERLAALEKATVRFETEPGHQLQADFGELFVLLGGVKTKVHLCVLTLGYSRRCFVKAFLSERQEQWLATFEAGFQYFGGVPLELLLDNAKALVVEHDTESRQVTFTQPLLSFCAQHRVTPRACRPCRARTKGKVESGVKYVKRNALAGQAFESFAALEAYLAVWIRDVADVRVHGTTHERPIDRFLLEQKALQPLRVVPALPLPLPRKVASDCLVNLDTNRYSVPFQFVGRKVEVRREAGMVAIWCDGQEVARHAELKGRHQTALKAEHVAGLRERLRPVQVPVEVQVQDVLAPYAELGGAA